MAEKNAPVSPKYPEYFPSLNEAATAPLSPPKTRRTTRKAGDTAKIPERSNTTKNKYITKSVTPVTAGMESFRDKGKDSEKVKMQKTIYNF